MQYTDTLKTIKDTLLNEEHLKKIQEFTQATASNTAFSFWREGDFWEYMAISLSVLAISKWRPFLLTFSASRSII